MGKGLRSGQPYRAVGVPDRVVQDVLGPRTLGVDPKETVVGTARDPGAVEVVHLELVMVRLFICLYETTGH